MRNDLARILKIVALAAACLPLGMQSDQAVVFPDKNLEAALRNNRALDYGALAIEDVAGVPTLVLTETLLADGATPDAVTRIIAALMRSARDLGQS